MTLANLVLSLAPPDADWATIYCGSRDIRPAAGWTRYFELMDDLGTAERKQIRNQALSAWDRKLLALAWAEMPEGT